MHHRRYPRLVDLLRADGSLPPLAGGEPTPEELEAEEEAAAAAAAVTAAARTVPLSKHTQERKTRLAAERRAEELEARLQEIEEKDKTEVERLTARLAALEQENSTLKSDTEKARKNAGSPRPRPGSITRVLLPR